MERLGYWRDPLNSWNRDIGNAHDLLLASINRCWERQDLLLRLTGTYKVLRTQSHSGDLGIPTRPGSSARDRRSRAIQRPSGGSREWSPPCLSLRGRNPFCAEDAGTHSRIAGWLEIQSVDPLLWLPYAEISPANWWGKMG